MKKYEIKKETFTGKIQVLYNNEGRLVYVNFEECEISDELRQSYKKHIPITLDGLPRFRQASNAELMPVDIVVTFEQWYKLLGVLRNKERAEAIWNKLPQTTHVEIFYSTKKYLRYCAKNASWYNKMYPDTYLRARHWETDWDKVKQ